jgi:hypothetical protein
MIEILGVDSDPAHTEGALTHFVNSDLGPELAQPHREIGVLHLPCEGFLQGTLQTWCGINVECSSGQVGRGEEWEALDVVPMGVGQ